MAAAKKNFFILRFIELIPILFRKNNKKINYSVLIGNFAKKEYFKCR